MKSPEKESVRDQILNAASLIFAKYGYKKSTMDDIGYALKKGKTAVYYYYKGKEDIFRAVVERESMLLGKSLENAVSKGKNADQKLTLYIQTRIQTLQKVSNFYNAMKSELLDSLEFINQARKNYDIFEISFVQKILDEGNECGCYRVDDTKKTAELIVNILKGLEIYLFIKMDQERLDEVTKDIIHIITYGLTNKKE